MKLNAIRGFLGFAAPVTFPVSRSKYMPHIGAKEQERAKRCRMTRYFSEWSANPRVAPTMQQMSKATARRVGV